MTRSTAFEELKLYAWALGVGALLILLIAYFGLFSSEEVLPESCLFQQAFHCKDHLLKAGNPDLVALIIQNELGGKVLVKEARAERGGLTASCTPSNAYLEPGESVKLECKGGLELKPGVREEVSIVLTYQAALEKTVKGRIYAQVQ